MKSTRLKAGVLTLHIEINARDIAGGGAEERFLRWPPHRGRTGASRGRIGQRQGRTAKTEAGYRCDQLFFHRFAVHPLTFLGLAVLRSKRESGFAVEQMECEVLLWPDLAIPINGLDLSCAVRLAVHRNRCDGYASRSASERGARLATPKAHGQESRKLGGRHSLPRIN